MLLIFVRQTDYQTSRFRRPIFNSLWLATVLTPVNPRFNKGTEKQNKCACSNMFYFVLPLLESASRSYPLSYPRGLKSAMALAGGAESSGSLTKSRITILEARQN